MDVEQRVWSEDKGWQICRTAVQDKDFQLVFVFGDRFKIEEPKRYEELKGFYPNGHIVFASSSGNILASEVDDTKIVASALFFNSTHIAAVRVNIHDAQSSTDAGEILAKQLKKEKLVHVILISDGHLVNGTHLIKGLIKDLPGITSLSGGLAGDGTRFEKTLVGLDAPPKEGEIVAIGFYGDALEVGLGSVGGWDPFGVERIITRSENNVLLELDGKSALKLYKTYLGEEAKNLPASALYFPLAVRSSQESPPIVRTVLAIDEERQGLVYAGDVPQGWYAQLMTANFDRLIDGASKAATLCQGQSNDTQPSFALLISCVGRRLVLGQRSEEEIEAVREVIGREVAIGGFYSYGEIAPSEPSFVSRLHNQTMTITTLSEK